MLHQITAEALQYGVLETWALFVIFFFFFSLLMVQLLHQLWAWLFLSFLWIVWPRTVPKLFVMGSQCFVTSSSFAHQIMILRILVGFFTCGSWAVAPNFVRCYFHWLLTCHAFPQSSPPCRVRERCGVRDAVASTFFPKLSSGRYVL